MARTCETVIGELSQFTFGGLNTHGQKAKGGLDPFHPLTDNFAFHPKSANKASDAFPVDQQTRMSPCAVPATAGISGSVCLGKDPSVGRLVVGD
jgi:hypothetical protein